MVYVSKMSIINKRKGSHLKSQRFIGKFAKRQGVVI